MNQEKAFKGATSNAPEWWLVVTMFFAGAFSMWLAVATLHECPNRNKPAQAQITGKEDCEELAQALADLEEVERSNSVFEYGRIVSGACVVVVNAAFQGETKAYSETQARNRIDMLLNKHGATP